MFSLPIISTALLLLMSPSSFHGVKAIDLQSARETACFPINETAPLDMEWVKSVKTWYYPIMSRLDLYETAVGVLDKDPKDIPENYLYYKSCPMFQLNGKELTTTWFNDKTKTWVQKPIKGLEHFELVDDNGSRGGTGYNIMTDNKTYSIVAFCLEPSNQMTWDVLSPLKTLPIETVQYIHNHMESLGFKREHFTGIQYDACKSE